MVTRRNVPEQETALGVRVDNLAGDVHGFRIELRDVRALMATREDIAGLTSSIKDIGSKQAPNFQAWAVFATVGIFLLTAFGYMAYRPLEQSNADTRAALAMMAERSISVREFDAEKAMYTLQIRDLQRQLDRADARK